MKKLDAKDCIAIEIDKETAKSFLDENHLQKSSKFIKAYGLLYKGELVKVTTFGKPRFNSNFQWELLNDCTKNGYSIHGGISELWKFFTKNNIVHSCISYSYPQDKKVPYTSKYVECCGFVNIEKSKPTKKIFYEGVWNGELKRIGRSVLERHGADRLLNGSFGQDKTNEQILLELGFKKKEEDGVTPQIDSYFPFGVVYRITDLDTGKFYIGKCEVKETWDDGYSGSGTKWKRHYNKYKDTHRFERVILKDNFRTPKEMFDYEAEEIKSNIDNKLCMNIISESQSASHICSECGKYHSHENWCSRYKRIEPCSECGRIKGHKSNCSKYNKNLTCKECGGKNGAHRKRCSRRKQANPCDECLTVNGHKKTCSRYRPQKGCEECGKTHGHHLETCSKYRKRTVRRCGECSGTNSHFKTCSKYKTSICSECNSKGGAHKKTCSKYREQAPCNECGSRGGHKKSCSRFKACFCDECEGKNGNHKKDCSKYKVVKCNECGGMKGNHKIFCSKYKGMCLECGAKRGHKKVCSKYKAPKPCEECGRIYNKHEPHCSKLLS